MRIFIEGESYPVKVLKDTFGEKFYLPNGQTGTIDSVGYYHTADHEVIYLLPKVFINTEGLILNRYRKEELAVKNAETVIGSVDELNWLRRFLIIFYRGLIEYRRRFRDKIQFKEEVLQLSTSLGENEYSFLDIVLSFANFYKNNKNTIVFIQKKHTSAQHKKINWSRTVKKSEPMFDDSGVPLYMEMNVKRNFLNTEEQLLQIFYSVLHHLKDEYNFNIHIESPYQVLRGKAYLKMEQSALKILKKIRYRYFSDVLVKMHKLLVLYFTKTDKVSISGKSEDFIMVKYYHLVFEDMIDKLISVEFNTKQTNKGISLKKLKDNKDGKIIDHLFEYESVIDRSESIYYIGDSKYYKSGNSISGSSVYKQFTYAKNIIQFNIDLLNEGKKINNVLRYRDDITEGYNITPNFFIQGVLDDLFNFDDDKLSVIEDKGVEHSYHFKERIFDRDSLFVNHFSINFLFVLKSYTDKTSSELSNYREIIHRKFRNSFIGYLKKQNRFKFYLTEFESEEELENFVSSEFRNLTGKIYSPKNNKKLLFLAVNNSDSDTKNKFTDYYNAAIGKREIFYSISAEQKVEFSVFKFDN